VYIGTAPASRAAAEEGMLRELRRLGDEAVSADELARGKAFLTGSFDLDLRTNERQSFYLGFFELMGAGHAYVHGYRERLEAVTGAGVQRVARRHLADPAGAEVGPD